MQNSCAEDRAEETKTSLNTLDTWAVKQRRGTRISAPRLKMGHTQSNALAGFWDTCQAPGWTQRGHVRASDILQVLRKHNGSDHTSVDVTLLVVKQYETEATLNLDTSTRMTRKHSFLKIRHNSRYMLTIGDTAKRSGSRFISEVATVRLVTTDDSRHNHTHDFGVSTYCIQCASCRAHDFSIISPTKAVMH